MNKLILTDVDETILRFADPFQDWIEARGFKTNGRLRDIYNIEHWIGIDHDTALELMDEFGRTEAMKNQPPEECALKVLPRLHSAGYRFAAITACGTSLAFQKQRHRTLEATFGVPFADVHVVATRGSKREHLESYPEAIWVEDSFNHAVVGAETGHRTFLLTRPYNVGLAHAGVTRVANWYDIEAALAAAEA